MSTAAECRVGRHSPKEARRESVTFAEMLGMRQEGLTHRGVLLNAAARGDGMAQLELIGSYGVWVYSPNERGEFVRSRGAL